MAEKAKGLCKVFESELTVSHLTQGYKVIVSPPFGLFLL
jgi:hypothetical protein